MPLAYALLLIDWITISTQGCGPIRSAILCCHLDQRKRHWNGLLRCSPRFITHCFLHDLESDFTQSLATTPIARGVVSSLAHSLAPTLLCYWVQVPNMLLIAKL